MKLVDIFEESKDKKQLNKQLKDINRQIKMLKGDLSPGESAVERVDKRNSLMQQKEEIIKQLREDQGGIGIIVGITDNGKFYDISVVDYNTLEPLTGHIENLGKIFIDIAEEYDAWDRIFPFLRNRLQGKKLGEEYSSEDAKFYIFGPVNQTQLTQVVNTFDQMIQR